MARSPQLTIRFPYPLLVRLERAAKRSGLGVCEYVRHLVRGAVGTPPAPPTAKNPGRGKPRLT